MVRKLNTPQDSLTQAARKAVRMGAKLTALDRDYPTYAASEFLRYLKAQKPKFRRPTNILKYRELWNFCHLQYIEMVKSITHDPHEAEMRQAIQPIATILTDLNPNDMYGGFNQLQETPAEAGTKLIQQLEAAVGKWQQQRKQIVQKADSVLEPQKSIKADNAERNRQAALFQVQMSSLGNDISDAYFAAKDKPETLKDVAQPFVHRAGALLDQFEKDFPPPYQTVGLDPRQAKGVAAGEMALKQANLVLNYLRQVISLNTKSPEKEECFLKAGLSAHGCAESFNTYSMYYLKSLPANAKPGSVPSALHPDEQPKWYKLTLDFMKYVHEVAPRIANRPGLTERQFQDVYQICLDKWRKIMNEATTSPQANSIKDKARDVSAVFNQYNPDLPNSQRVSGGVGDRAEIFFQLLYNALTEWVRVLKSQGIPV